MISGDLLHKSQVYGRQFGLFLSYRNGKSKKYHALHFNIILLVRLVVADVHVPLFLPATDVVVIDLFFSPLHLVLSSVRLILFSSLPFLFASALYHPSYSPCGCTSHFTIFINGSSDFSLGKFIDKYIPIS